MRKPFSYDYYVLLLQAIASYLNMRTAAASYKTTHSYNMLFNSLLSKVFVKCMFSDIVGQGLDLAVTEGLH